ncbi:hypothetical protein ACHHYP_10809 [Achlya hypogyna]|uniref:Transmembrane protein 231 n=1 Tax=Achlya hypogyna TaxID=1202772 RepID=A0A1V9YKH5_ACHHY|nr:hypothetical protein ACHHYP_10809 [Achlya hypogyna]
MRAIHREPVVRQYYANVCSCGYLLSWASLITTILLPLLLVYNPTTFWPRSVPYKEQPNVDFLYQVLLVAEGTAVDSNGNVAGFSAFWSSLPSSINQLAAGTLRPGQIKSYSEDDNSDGVTDRLSLQLSMPIHVGEAIHKASLLVVLNTSLRTNAQLDMDAVALISHASPLPAISLYTVCDLELSVKSPLALTTEVQTPYASAAVLNVSNIIHANDLRLERFVLAQNRRENKAIVRQQQHVWIQDANGVAVANRVFVMNATINVPTADISYIPTFYQTLQTGWIQVSCTFGHG